MELDSGEHKQICKECPTKKLRDVNVKIMKGFMAVVFNMGLIRKNGFTDHWSTQQSINTPWFCMMFSRDLSRKILRAFHIVNNTIVPTIT